MELGLTCKQLAEVVGIKRPYMSQLETGHMPLPPDVVTERIADALGLDVRDLYVLEGRVPPEVRDAFMRTPEAFFVLAAQSPTARQRFARTGSVHRDDGPRGNARDDVTGAREAEARRKRLKTRLTR